MLLLLTSIQGNTFCQVNIWNLHRIWSGHQSGNSSFNQQDLSMTEFQVRFLYTSTINEGRHDLLVYSVLEVWKNTQMTLEVFIQSTREFMYVPSAKESYQVRLTSLSIG